MLYTVGTKISLKKDFASNEPKENARVLYWPGTKVLLVNAANELTLMKITSKSFAFSTSPAA